MSDGDEHPLWNGPAPGSESWSVDEAVSIIDGPPPRRWIRNVSVPTITEYVPPDGSDRAVVILPGGALHFVSIDSEGHGVGELVRAAGVAAFVVKYRVVPTPAADDEFGAAVMRAFETGIEDVAATTLPLAVADALRALEIVRDRGYSHVTLLGFSAGGRITAEILGRRDHAQQPDAAAIVYLPSVHDTTAAPDAPPLFVLAAADDPLGIEGSLDLHRAWRDAGRPVELHLFERGGHGFGIDPTGSPVEGWPELFLAWLATRSRT